MSTARRGQASAAAAASSSQHDDGGGDVPLHDDPALNEQLRADAMRAADAGAAQALSEAQAASAQAQRREQDEFKHDDQGGQEQYDLGQEFAAYAPSGSHGATFITGLDASASQANLAHQQQQQHQQSQQPQQQSQQPPAEQDMRMSDEELIGHVEKQMMEYERTAQYLEAEKARKHLESLKQRSVKAQPSTPRSFARRLADLCSSPCLPFVQLRIEASCCIGAYPERGRARLLRDGCATPIEFRCHLVYKSR